MADRQQCQLLQQGVGVWNEWRRNHPTVSVDLRDADLRSANLYDPYQGPVNLIDADLSGANLGSVALFRGNLLRANLSHAKLTSTQLMRADLTNANLQGATLCFTNLARADLTDADLSGANLRGASLWRANLHSAKTILGAYGLALAFNLGVGLLILGHGEHITPPSILAIRLLYPFKTSLAVILFVWSTWLVIITVQRF